MQTSIQLMSTDHWLQSRLTDKTGIFLTSFPKFCSGQNIIMISMDRRYPPAVRLDYLVSALRLENSKLFLRYSCLDNKEGKFSPQCPPSWQGGRQGHRSAPRHDNSDISIPNLRRRRGGERL